MTTARSVSAQASISWLGSPSLTVSAASGMGCWASRDDGWADAVVAAVLVSDTDNSDIHRRSTVRRRRCVEQEMHGS